MFSHTRAANLHFVRSVPALNAVPAINAAPDFQALHSLAQQILSGSPVFPVNATYGMPGHGVPQAETMFTALPVPQLVPFQDSTYFPADDILQRGLPNASIAGLPIGLMRGAQKDELCAICHDSFRANRFSRQLPCTHVFHPHCIGEWLSRSTLCPVCRHELAKRSGVQ